MKVSNEDIGLAAIIVAIAFAALSLGLFSDWNLGKADSIVAVVQGFATVVAIGLAGLFAYQKLNVFRTFYPHLTISHEISHRFVGDSYVHLSVTAILQNNSNVKIDIQEAFFWLQQIAPLPDEDVEAYRAEVFAERKYASMRWPTLEEVHLNWHRNELIVEPGGSHRETLDFVVLKEVETVRVYTYFYNPNFSEQSGNSEGWQAIMAYDIQNSD